MPLGLGVFDACNSQKKVTCRYNLDESPERKPLFRALTLPSAWGDSRP